MQPQTALVQAMVPVRRSLEVAEIFRAHADAYCKKHRITMEQKKAITDIQRCRTAALGGHVDICDNSCGYMRISYNSCRNRHCPKCQTLQSEKWLEKRSLAILPTRYFHVVVTVPHQLNPLILHNKRVLYKILFRAAAQSLLQLARDWKGLQAQIGFTAILHTWNQDMRFHPHIHMVVTAGGLDQSSKRWIEPPYDFLLPVSALSKKVRGKFLHHLKRAYRQGNLVFHGSIEHLKTPEAFGRFVDNLYCKNWVVYSKAPFTLAESVFRYLSHYTHRVAISNQRLVRMTDQEVTFLARDNHNTQRKRSVTVTPEEFIRRFLLHVLPAGFVKIRHYGLLAPRNAKTKLKIARSLIEDTKRTRSEPSSTIDHNHPHKTWQQLFHHLTGIDPTVCPRCANGRLIRHPLSFLDRSITMDHRIALLDSS
jgi:Putative transposase/Transposase zinc-binding domain